MLKKRRDIAEEEESEGRMCGTVATVSRTEKKRSKGSRKTKVEL